MTKIADLTMPNLVLIVLSIFLGTVAGVASRWGALALSREWLKKVHLKHEDEISHLTSEMWGEKLEMQYEIDGLKTQICTERDLNIEYQRDLLTLSQSLKMEQELTETLYEALIVQEPKLKRQFDPFNKAKKMYLEMRK